MITENLSTLKIHKLTKAQYERELDAGNIDENALYLTPDEEINLSGYATEDYVENAIAAIPTPDVSGQIEAHNVSESAHSDIRSELSLLSGLVGDAPVSDQINAAMGDATKVFVVSKEEYDQLVANGTVQTDAVYMIASGSA